MSLLFCFPLRVFSTRIKLRVKHCTKNRKWPDLSLYLITASTIFFIFLVRLGGFGVIFSAGGRPRFFCLLLSSSLSLAPRVPDVDGPASRSRSRFLFRVVFLWRTSSSISSSVPSSIAYIREKILNKVFTFNYVADITDHFKNSATSSFLPQ